MFESTCEEQGSFLDLCTAESARWFVTDEEEEQEIVLDGESPSRSRLETRAVQEQGSRRETRGCWEKKSREW